MKTTRTFTMNGKTYQSMMEIARELGVKRVYPRDFEKYGITEVSDDSTVAPADKEVKPVQEDKKEDKKEATKKVEQPVEKKVEKKVETVKKAKEDKAVDEDKVDKRFTRRLGTPEQIKESQDNVPNMTVVEFNDSIKHFTIDALVQMVEAVDAKTWETITNEPIRRMRLLMELKNHYYPNDKTPVKPSSGWRKFELDELLQFAKDHKVEYKTSDNTKIQRMWVVQALNAANLTPDDVPQKKEETVNA